MTLKDILRRRRTIFGFAVPIWAYLLMGVLIVSATITIITQKGVREEVTVEAVGLDFVGIDVGVLTNGLVTVSYSVYEESIVSITEAYEIQNNNPNLLDSRVGSPRHRRFSKNFSLTRPRNNADAFVTHWELFTTSQLLRFYQRDRISQLRWIFMDDKLLRHS